MTNANPTEVQLSVDSGEVPKADLICNWVNHVLSIEQRFGDLVIRFVPSDESQQLNQTFRQTAKPTNVLAFPSEVPNEIQAEHPILGDIVICPEVVINEAQQYGKSHISHFAHMVIHGLLHVLGYDHQTADEQRLMESKEIDYLKQLGFTNPYEVCHHYV